MSEEYKERVRALTPAKALAIGAYGESVASYRYRTLAEKTADPKLRDVFLEMADEEHCHHNQVLAILKEYFPGSDFVLSPADKELVTVGSRMIEVGDEASNSIALNLMYESERLTGKYYSAIHDVINEPALKPFLKEMADECFEHASRLQELSPTD